MTSGSEDGHGGNSHRHFPAVIADITRETRDTSTLHLFVGPEDRKYLAGQFLTIDPHQFLALDPLIRWLEHEKKAKEPPRAYSMASAPADPFVSITVKIDGFREGVDKYPPLLSPYLVDGCRVGQTLDVRGYMGHYVMKDWFPEDAHIVHLCAGSGIVPSYSILRDVLPRGLPQKHTLIYGNRTFADIIFRDAIDELAEKYPDRLKVVHALSRDPQYVDHPVRTVHRGRVDGSLLAKHLSNREKTWFYLCGPAITRWERVRAKQSGEAAPPRFIETMLHELEALGIAKDRVEKEAFG